MGTSSSQNPRPLGRPERTAQSRHVFAFGTIRSTSLENSFASFRLLQCYASQLPLRSATNAFPLSLSSPDDQPRPSRGSPRALRLPRTPLPLRPGTDAQDVNTRRNHSGHLWHKRFYSCPLSFSRLTATLNDVQQKPCRAGLVERLEDYRWSSAQVFDTRFFGFSHCPTISAR